MDITVFPGKLSGTISAIPSKSQAHRVLICAAFSDIPTTIYCKDTNQDIEATAGCLNTLGATITRTDYGYYVIPIKETPNVAQLDCNESGSTLRFMLPIVAACGVDTTFLMSGRLPQRPLSPLWEELVRMGCNLDRPTENTLRCRGQLRGGAFCMDGSVSSQYITGLLFAMALLPTPSTLELTGKIESAPYISMTLDALKRFGIDASTYTFSGKQRLTSPGSFTIEGDWSNAAFFLAANALGSSVSLENLNMYSVQGDRLVSPAITELSKNATISAADTPDIVPILSIVAGAKHGGTFTDVRRLRLKESDRVATVAAMLQNLGCTVSVSENELTISPGQFQGCTIDSAGDHRIAMSAAIAATIASSPVTIINAQCVSKSYPAFWNDFKKLGGIYE